MPPPRRPNMVINHSRVSALFMQVRNIAGRLKHKNNKWRHIDEADAFLDIPAIGDFSGGRESTRLRSKSVNTAKCCELKCFPVLSVSFGDASCLRRIDVRSNNRLNKELSHFFFTFARAPLLPMCYDTSRNFPEIFINYSGEIPAVSVD